MSLFDWAKPVSKAIDVVDQFVEDKDEKNRLTADLKKLGEQVYMAELGTKTVTWVDALHKMGRQLTSWATLGMGFYLLNTNPEITPGQLAAIGGPGALYTWMKGRGK